MKKIKATRGWSCSLSSETVDGETNAFVIKNGRRVAKITQSEAYFQTVEEAIDWILSYNKQAVDIAKSRLEYAENELSKAIEICKAGVK